MRRSALVLLLTLLAAPAWCAQSLHIAVASNFAPVLAKISEAFTKTSGIAVTTSSASTGVLASQITNGAPFDLFFSADRAAPEQLRALPGLKDNEFFCYALGNLVLVGADSLDALAKPELSLAIANPTTAPYGVAAMEVLARPEFQAGAQRTLVRGNNVAQTYQFWHSKAADLALVPRALALDGLPIPLDWHKPITQYALVLKPGAEIDAFLAWLRSDAVQTQILEAGYDACP